METTRRRRGRRRRRSEAHQCKRRRRISSEYSFPSLFLHLDAGNTLFCVLLAALSKARDAPDPNTLPLTLNLIEKCLHRLHLSLRSDAKRPIFLQHQLLPAGLLALCPAIVKSRFTNIACLGTKIVGAASLKSFEMNEQIASDADVVKSLLLVLRSSSKRLTMAVCCAILDLSTSSVGRKTLLECCAPVILMSSFLQDSKSLVDKPLTAHKEEETARLLLDTTIVLVNSCSYKQLERLSVELSESFLVVLKELWSRLHDHDQMLVNVSLYSTNWKVNDLAESIFRLSTIVPCAASVPLEVIRGMFGPCEANFEDFLKNHWEASPLLMNTRHRVSNENFSFWSVLHPFNSRDLTTEFTISAIQNMVSCPPIASDELNILNFVNQERDKLGMPIIYQQDIRVLKVERCLNQETHFFQKSSDSCNQVPYFLNSDDIAKCEEALGNGYTIALRGLEFRFKNIAAVTESLASLFGQPSVGANLYLTPPNSQGLARHYDDHCVFICQLIGSKQWVICPPKCKQLPRLYEPIGVSDSQESSDSAVNGSMQILLKEGDVLYIPRGFIHEACTTNDGLKEGMDGWSFHLTLAVEVEPPFEWEGFTHLALICWAKTRKELLVKLLPANLDVVLNLLHIMIGSIADADTAFRRACLVGSFPLSSYTNDSVDSLHQSQRAIFSYLIDKIDGESGFSEIFADLEMAIQEKTDLFHRIRWVEWIDKEERELEEHNQHMFQITTEDILSLCSEDRDMIEKGLRVLKSKFCKEVMFDDVVSSYLVLLEKFKKVRMQYLNGMLSLHCKLN